MNDFIKTWLITTAVALGGVLFVMLLAWSATISIALFVVVFAIGFGGVVALVTEYL